MHPSLQPQLTAWELVFLAVGMVAISEVGYQFGRRFHRRAQEAKKPHVGTVIAALLALLGLLLAFSFSAVETRFARRRALVLDEANAIGTAYLRAKMIPAPYDARVQSLLRRYASYRLVTTNAEQLERAIAASEELHDELWQQATEVARAHPESEIVGLFVQALNNMIDLQESRVTVALHQRLPAAVLWILYIVSLLSSAMLGVGTGLHRQRSPLPTAALVLVITAVVALIVDLDRPASRLFHISQSALDDTRATMAADLRAQAHPAASE